MSNSRGDARREAILSAAARLITQKGFARVRMADVAAEAGISPALLFYHFDSKDKLLVEAYREASRRDLAEMESIITGPGSCARRLRRAIGYLLPQGQALGWIRDFEAWIEGRYDPQVRRACREMDASWRHCLERVIVEGCSRGEFHCEDPATAAQRISMLLDGLAVGMRLHGTLGRGRAQRWAGEFAAGLIGLEPSALGSGG